MLDGQRGGTCPDMAWDLKRSFHAVAAAYAG
jgi:hypothetical protein